MVATNNNDKLHYPKSAIDINNAEESEVVDGRVVVEIPNKIESQSVDGQEPIS